MSDNTFDLEKEFEKFEKCLRTHDWYYQMSDDYSVYDRGTRERGTINAIYYRLKTIDKDRADQMYNKYSKSC